MQGIIFPLNHKTCPIVHSGSNNADDNECTFLFPCFLRRLQFCAIRSSTPTSGCIQCTSILKMRLAPTCKPDFGVLGCLSRSRSLGLMLFLRDSLTVWERIPPYSPSEKERNLSLSWWVPFHPHVPTVAIIVHRRRLDLSSVMWF